jgi:AcrR family transcriptional regulator
MVRIVKNPKERKEEIVVLACKLFLTKGYDKTTMRDVMTQLNIAKGTIYHYFKSKEDLLEAVLLHIAKDQEKKLIQIFDETSGNAVQRIQQFVILSVASKENHEEWIEHLHKPANAGMHIQLLAKLISFQAPFYEKLIIQGCEEGLFSTSQPLTCAEFILSGIQFLIDQGIYPWSENDMKRRIMAFPEILESMLRAPEGSFQFMANIPL